MSKVHLQARTTPRTKVEIKCLTVSTACLAECYNITRVTARKWLTRDNAADRSHRSRRAHDLGTTLSARQ